jgi:hypothetical protein
MPASTIGQEDNNMQPNNWPFSGPLSSSARSWGLIGQTFTQSLEARLRLRQNREQSIPLSAQPPTHLLVRT